MKQARNAPRRKRPGPPKGRALTAGSNTALLNLLAQKHLTQETLAKRIGAAPSSISHVFRGRKGLSLRRAEQIAAVLGVSMEKLGKVLGGS